MTERFFRPVPDEAGRETTFAPAASVMMVDTGGEPGPGAFSSPTDRRLAVPGRMRCGEVPAVRLAAFPKLERDIILNAVAMIAEEKLWKTNSTSMR